jgi:F-type H+-transporting ATPase subunit delta
MIEKRTLSRPYAKAIFEIAKANNSFKKWTENLRILSLVVQNKEVSELLNDSSLSTQEIESFFFEILEKCCELDEALKNFIRILSEGKRLVLLPDIFSSYEELRMEAENLIRVNIKTPYALSEPEKKKFEVELKKYLSRTVILECEIDKTLIGGFFAEAGNSIIDGSVRGYLNNLKQEMGE